MSVHEAEYFCIAVHLYESISVRYHVCLYMNHHIKLQKCVTISGSGFISDKLPLILCINHHAILHGRLGLAQVRPSKQYVGNKKFHTSYMSHEVKNV